MSKKSGDQTPLTLYYENWEKEFGLTETFSPFQESLFWSMLLVLASKVIEVREDETDGRPYSQLLEEIVHKLTSLTEQVATAQEMVGSEATADHQKLERELQKQISLFQETVQVALAFMYRQEHAELQVVTEQIRKASLKAKVLVTHRENKQITPSTAQKHPTV